MNIRCSFCQMPYAIGRNEMLGALQKMNSENLNHYDAHCPRCKRATQIPRQRMEMFFPNWRDALKDLEAEMKVHPQQAAPPPAPAAEIESKPAPAAARVRARSAAQKPAVQKPAVKKAPTPAKKAPAKKSK